MGKKLKKSKKTIVKNKLKKKNNKTLINNQKSSSNKKEFLLTDIEKKIIDYIKNNSNTNYYSGEAKTVKLYKEILEKVKGSCLCRISDEFGTAVCINKNGYILTCSHAAPPFEDEKNKESIYIFPDGEIVKTITIEKNEQLDLALLKIIEIFKNGKFIKKTPQKKFLYSKIKSSNENEKIGENIFCIGNPCFIIYNDNKKLEKNNYKPFWISFGKIKGYLKDKIYGENNLGPLIHDCWTYWGHSGAPIFNINGEIIGMHNSWNEKNANRHGISLLGINLFLSKFVFLNKEI
jgi:hypothetical protein